MCLKDDMRVRFEGMDGTVYIDTDPALNDDTTCLQFHPDGAGYWLDISNDDEWEAIA
jgi:hypothetical protein